MERDVVIGMHACSVCLHPRVDEDFVYIELDIGRLCYEEHA